MKNTIRNIIVFVTLALLPHIAIAEGTSARILKLVNPSQSTGIRIGDTLQRKVVIEVSEPYQISSTTLPLKGTNRDGIEVSDMQVTSTRINQKIRYEVAIKYQVFAHASAPAIMELPAEEFALTGGPKALSVKVPAWRFWFSPLVVADINTAKNNMQPQYGPSLIDWGSHQYMSMGFLCMLLVGLAGLLYFNADSRWLPFMNGAFSQAYRKIRKLPSDQEWAWKKGLVHLHEAFNKVHGANLFADDITSFVEAHPEFGKIKGDIENFFVLSNRSLFAEPPNDCAQFIKSLAVFSKHLRDCERGAA